MEQGGDESRKKECDDKDELRIDNWLTNPSMQQLLQASLPSSSNDDDSSSKKWIRKVYLGKSYLDACSNERKIDLLRRIFALPALQDFYLEDSQRYLQGIGVRRNRWNDGFGLSHITNLLLLDAAAASRSCFTSLRLTGIEFQDVEDVSDLARFVASLQNLQVFELCGPGSYLIHSMDIIQAGRTHVRTNPDLLPRLRNFEAVLDALANLPHCRKISLGIALPLDFDNFSTSLQNLVAKPGLEELELQLGILTVPLIRAIGRGLAATTTTTTTTTNVASSLTSLSLSGDLFDCTQNEFAEALAFLVASAQQQSLLTNLSVECSGLNDQGMAILLPLLQRNTTIRNLSLAMNELRDAKLIARLVEENTTLYSLNLSSNSLMNGDGDGADALLLAKALMSNATLQELLLQNNNSMFPSVARAFAEALTKNETLKKLCLTVLNVSERPQKALLQKRGVVMDDDESTRADMVLATFESVLEQMNFTLEDLELGHDVVVSDRINFYLDLNRRQRRALLLHQPPPHAEEKSSSSSRRLWMNFVEQETSGTLDDDDDTTSLSRLYHYVRAFPGYCALGKKD